jgi:hypothetical protein
LIEPSLEEETGEEKEEPNIEEYIWGRCGKVGLIERGSNICEHCRMKNLRKTERGWLRRGAGKNRRKNLRLRMHLFVNNKKSII